MVIKNFKKLSLLVSISLMMSLFFSSYALAASVSLTLDRHSTTLEEPIRIQVIVEGTQNAPKPQIQNTSQFDVQKGGTSTQIQIVNGRTTRSITYQFVLYPRKEGKFRIGPAIVNINGKTISSNEVSINVLKASQVQKERLYYITANVNKQSVYVNEQVVYTFQFFTRVRVVNSQLEQLEFNGFWREEFGKQREYEKQINGITWLVSEFKVALFPTREGILNIPTATLAADFVLKTNRRSSFDSFFDDSFFGRSKTKRVRLRTKAIDINVKPLPLEGKSKYFSGLVGNIKMNSSISKKSLDVGDSSTLTITLKGDGNIRDAKIPAPSWSDVKVYHDEPNFKVDQSRDLLYGTKTFKKAIVPTKEGKLKLSSLRVDYFDLTVKEYKVLHSPEMELDISPGSGETLSHMTASDSQFRKQRIEVLGEDIMPIKRTLNALDRDALSQRQRWLFLLFIVLCPIFYFVAKFIKNYQDRIHGDVGYVKRSRAYKNFLRELGELNGSGKFFEKSSIALRTYLGDKLNIDGRAMTADDTKRFLSNQNLPMETLESIEKYIRDCEAGQFGGKSLSERDQEKMLKNLSQLTRKLEKEIKV